jgi:hypothetical protein
MKVERDQMWLETIQKVTEEKSNIIDRLECLLDIKDGLMDEKDDEIILLKQDVARLKRALFSITKSRDWNGE